MEQLAVVADEVQEAGIWTWSIDEDLLYADTAFAKLFGIDLDEALRGLPIERYLARIHAEDRGRIAQSITDAVIGGAAYYAEYKVSDYLGLTRQVITFGRCFRSRLGNPVHVAGIAYPLDSLF